MTVALITIGWSATVRNDLGVLTIDQKIIVCGAVKIRRAAGSGARMFSLHANNIRQAATLAAYPPQPSETDPTMRGMLANLILRLIALFPLSIVHRMGSVLGVFFWVSRSQLRRVTEINLRRCMPELLPSERRQLARATLRETGKAMTEIGPLWCWDVERALALVRNVSGEDTLLAAMRAGRGVVLAAPHLGCWEIIGLYLARRCPMTILYRPPRFADIERLMVSARERGGATLAPTSPVGVRHIYQVLARHGCAGILPDQDPAEGGGVFAPFFGVPAYTMTLIPRLIRKTGAAVFIGYARRLPKGAGYDLHFIPAELDGANDDEAGAAALNRGIERAVREMPEQYQWGYRRFKTRPPGDGRFY